MPSKKKSQALPLSAANLIAAEENMKRLAEYVFSSTTLATSPKIVPGNLTIGQAIKVPTLAELEEALEPKKKRAKKNKHQVTIKIESEL